MPAWLECSPASRRRRRRRRRPCWRELAALCGRLLHLPVVLVLLPRRAGPQQASWFDFRWVAEPCTRPRAI